MLATRPAELAQNTEALECATRGASRGSVPHLVALALPRVSRQLSLRTLLLLVNPYPSPHFSQHPPGQLSLQLPTEESAEEALCSVCSEE
jgi:hypothetical protein